MAKKEIVAVEMSTADLGPRTEQAKSLEMANKYYKMYTEALRETAKLRVLNEGIPKLMKKIEELEKRIEELNHYDRSNLLDFD